MVSSAIDELHVKSKLNRKFNPASKLIY